MYYTTNGRESSAMGNDGRSWAVILHLKKKKGGDEHVKCWGMYLSSVGT